VVSIPYDDPSSLALFLFEPSQPAAYPPATA
jgi:hypothetical protein